MNSHASFHAYEPLQFKVILPVDRTERCLRSIQLFVSAFPVISWRLYLFHAMDPWSMTEENEFRNDLDRLLSQNTSGNYPQIIIRKGRFAPALANLCSSKPFDLMILPYHPLKNGFYLQRQSNIWKLVSRMSFPILLVPDSMESIKQTLKPERILAIADPSQDASSVNSFLMKACRLINTETHLILNTTRRSRKDAGSIMDRLMHRYIPSEQFDGIKLHLSQRHKHGYTEQLIRSIKPGLVMFSSSAENLFSKTRDRSFFEYLLGKTDCPLLFIRRKNWFFRLEKEFRKRYGGLSSFELVEDDEGAAVMSEESISGLNLLLGVYGRKGIERALREYGFLKKLARIGYTEIRIDLDTSDAFRHRLRIFGGRSTQMPPLVDIILRLQQGVALDPLMKDIPDHSRRFLVIDWLCLQDPLRVYAPGMVPLFGQEYPGLGMGWRVMMLLRMMARRLDAAGIYIVPEYYHTARLFHRFFSFASPEHEGRMLAMDRDSFPLHAIDVSWAMYHHLMKEHSQEKPVVWSGSPQIQPLSASLRKHFRSTAYRDAVLKVLKEKKFFIDLATVRDYRESGKLYLTGSK